MKHCTPNTNKHTMQRCSVICAICYLQYLQKNWQGTNCNAVCPKLQSVQHYLQHNVHFCHKVCNALMHSNLCNNTMCNSDDQFVQNNLLQSVQHYLQQNKQICATQLAIHWCNSTMCNSDDQKLVLTSSCCTLCCYLVVHDIAGWLDVLSATKCSNIVGRAQPGCFKSAANVLQRRNS